MAEEMKTTVEKVLDDLKPDFRFFPLPPLPKKIAEIISERR